MPATKKQAGSGVCLMAALLSLLPGTSGCSSGPGGPFSFNGPNRLTVDARKLREASGPPSAIARELDKQVAGPYIIEPGDVLLVQPTNLESPIRLPGDQVVLPDGTIQLGQFGHVPVAGKILTVIEAEVNDLIKSKIPDAEKILVRLITRESKVFYVLGEVNSPNAFPLRGRETVLDAIVTAGGLNSNASRNRIILSRPTGPDSCRLVLPVKYDDIVQLGDTTTNYQIRAGDRVFVPTKTLWETLCPEKGSCPPPIPCQTNCGTIAPKDNLTTFRGDEPVPSASLLPPPNRVSSPTDLSR